MVSLRERVRNNAYRTDLDSVMESLKDLFSVRGSFSSTDFRNIRENAPQHARQAIGVVSI